MAQQATSQYGAGKASFPNTVGAPAKNSTVNGVKICQPALTLAKEQTYEYMDKGHALCILLKEQLSSAIEAGQQCPAESRDKLRTTVGSLVPAE